MIKGVSKQILEITNTGNPYFERAFLVVSTPFTDRPDIDLQHEAQLVLKAHEGYSGLRIARRFRRWQRTAWLVVGMALGALAVKIVVML